MVRDTKKRVAFVSSFPPRRCGIATFTSDLIASTAIAADAEFEPHAMFVAALTLDNSTYAEVALKTAGFLLDNTFDGDPSEEAAAQDRIGEA